MGKRGRATRIDCMFADSDSGSDSSDSDVGGDVQHGGPELAGAADVPVLPDGVGVSSDGPSAVKSAVSAKVRPTAAGRDLLQSDSQLLNSVLASSTLLRDDAAAPSSQCIEPKLGRHAAARKRREERAKTAGGDWFGMRKAELNDESRRDLELLQMRNALDPKAHYRNNDRPVLPKYFEVGTVIHDATDYYSKPTKKQQKESLLDEIMADQKILTYQKRLYSAAKREDAIRKRGAFQKAQARKKVKK